MVGQTRYERELRHFREFPSEQLACLLGLLLVRLQKFRGADAATLGFSSIKPSVSSTGLSTRINTDVFRRFWKQYWLSSRGPLLRPSSICKTGSGRSCGHMQTAAFFTALAATPVLHQRSPQPGKHCRTRQRHIQKHPLAFTGVPSRLTENRPASLSRKVWQLLKPEVWVVQ